MNYGEKSVLTHVDDFTGPRYVEVLKALHERGVYDNYLEIGTFRGESLAIARGNVFAIDPDMSQLAISMNKKKSCMLFQMTSEEFFQSNNPISCFAYPIEFAFLDGLHLFEFLLQDFINCEKYCARSAIIVLHDCIPTDVEITSRVNDKSLRSRHPNWWAGDVWKMIPILRRWRPDLDIIAIDSSPTGLLIIKNLDPMSTVLYENYIEIKKAWINVDLLNYGLLKFLDEASISSAAHFIERIIL